MIQKIGGEEDANGPWYRGTQVLYNNVGQVALSKLIKWQYEAQGTPPVPTPVRQTALAAMEYRYDSGRQRYLVRARNPVNLLPYALSDGAWSDYSGNDIYGDYSTAPGGAVTETMGHVPGLAQYDAASAVTSYLHGNLIGTNEVVTGSTGVLPVTARRVFTAFGEPVYVAQPPSAGNRYGYAGAWGYQSGNWDSAPGACDTGIGSANCDPLAALGWLHVGERYYDPSSGRFVQRDPIGIRGGLNTYMYVGNIPTFFVDPMGLEWWNPFDNETIARGFLWVTDKGHAISGIDLDNQDALNEAAQGFGRAGATAAGIGAGIGVGSLCMGAIGAAGGGAAGGTITGYTGHGITQAIGRDGVGVAGRAILDAVRNPIQTIQQSGGSIKYIGSQAVVVLNQAGQVITTWATSSGGWRVK